MIIACLIILIVLGVIITTIGAMTYYHHRSDALYALVWLLIGLAIIVCGIIGLCVR